ncbi:MAG: type II toxin-antitoxin system VapC family toxin, partial [Synechocystis sp.]
ILQTVRSMQRGYVVMLKVVSGLDKVGLIDALIAACAIGLNSTLCTFNVKHYRIIAGLNREQSYNR